MPQITLVRGSHSQTFESPYDNEQALRRLMAMLQDRTVNSSFARGIVLACRKRSEDANDWAWVHRIVLDHEKNKHPSTIAPAKPVASVKTTAQAVRTNALLNAEQVQEFTKGLLKTMSVAVVRRHIDESFIKDASDPTQAAKPDIDVPDASPIYPRPVQS